jgi:hypothetical protein
MGLRALHFGTAIRRRASRPIACEAQRLASTISRMALELFSPVLPRDFY